MLAAASAWRILEAEHTRLRNLLSAIARVIDEGGWERPGARMELLRRRIRDFQAFEARTHRPKGVVLLQSMRGRSAAADQLLDVIDDDSRECDELLAQALALLQELEQGDAAHARELAFALQQHRERMTQQLDREDTALRAYTSQLLTSEEWSAVVSSISSVVHKR